MQTAVSAPRWQVLGYAGFCGFVRDACRYAVFALCNVCASVTTATCAAACRRRVSATSMSHASTVQGKDGRGKDTGNGRVIVSKLEANGSDCVWATQKLIEVPKTADFKDYSDMDIHGDKGPISRIAITSQVCISAAPACSATACLLLRASRQAPAARNSALALLSSMAACVLIIMQSCLVHILRQQTTTHVVA